MNLWQRLLAGALAVAAALVLAILIVAGTRLHDRLERDSREELAHNARLVGIAWTKSTVDPDSLADATGEALDRRVTLIATAGTVVGDSEFDDDALRRLDNHSDRPEIVAAQRSGVGSDVRSSASAGDEEMYVAIRHPLGFVRVSMTTSAFGAVVAGAQRDVMIASLIGVLGAIVLAGLFARRVSRPIVELRDVTRAIAAGDLQQRPSLTADGEVGDLAASVRRMAEELDRRIRTVEDEDARLIAIIESLDEAIVAIDARGDVVRINESARRLFAARNPLPFPATSLTLTAPMRGAITAALKGDGSAGTESRLGERTVSVTVRPLPGGGAVLAVLDLTERRRLEMVRRDFVANVSHELKTPLTVIGGFTETLRDPQLLEEDRQRFLELMSTNTTRMQRIVDDLLDLSRYESDTWTPKPADVDLQAVTDEVLAAAKPSTGVRLESQIAPDSRHVRLDPTAVRQVLSNLVENAVRYTSSGSVSVRATRSATYDLVIAVTDTGVGIPADHLSRIFERFYRVDPGRSRADGGTGLGLAIVRHLVEAHGGRVTASSEPGSGTTITIQFPAAGK